MLSTFLGILSDADKALVDRIFLEYNEKLYYLALRILKSEADAQDAVAQTFLKISEHIEKIRSLPEDELAPYCSAITKNAALDMIRYRGRVASKDEVVDPNLEIFSGVERQFMESLNRRLLLEAVERLSEADRYLIQLRYVYDLAFRDIAEILETGEDAARKRVQRLIGRLRALYGKVENEKNKNG